jgi:hypothetical protein
VLAILSPVARHIVFLAVGVQLSATTHCISITSTIEKVARHHATMHNLGGEQLNLDRSDNQTDNSERPDWAI